jgi:hypothetical protein
VHVRSVPRRVQRWIKDDARRPRQGLTWLIDQAAMGSPLLFAALHGFSDTPLWFPVASLPLFLGGRLVAIGLASQFAWARARPVTVEDAANAPAPIYHPPELSGIPVVSVRSVLARARASTR